MLWKPLLSATVPIDPETGDFDWSVIPFPVWGSTKVDGFRAMVQDAVLVSRNGLPIRNKTVQAKFCRSNYEGLDVELTAGSPHGENVFNATSRVVTSADAAAEHVRMNVIDYMAQAQAVPFSLGQRISVLKSTYQRDRANTSHWQGKGIYLIKQVLIKNISQLKSFEACCLSDGYEGVMLRRADQGEYPQKPGKENRSTLREFYLARLKRFEYDLATIVAAYPLRHNANDARTGAGRRSSSKAGIVIDATQIGSVTLKDKKTGVLFDTNVATNLLRGKGMTWWTAQKGKAVRYKYQVCGTKDKPRINTCAFEELLS